MEKHKHCPFCGFNNTKADVEVGEICRMAKVSCQICGATARGIGVMIGNATDESLIESAYKFWDARSEARE